MFEQISQSETTFNIVAQLLGKMALLSYLFFIAAGILFIIGMWKVFKKAGEPGWAALIPIYNFYLLVIISRLHWGYFIALVVLMFATMIQSTIILSIIAIVFVIYTFVVYIKIAKAFGKSAGFGVFTTFFPYIGLMILGCGKSEYQK